MKIIANLLVLAALIGGITIACVSSTAPKSATTSVSADLPSAGCARQASSPDVVEQCGQCTIIGLSSAAARDALAHSIASAAAKEAWFDVGPTWLGGDDGTTLSGAAYCADRFGGTVRRFTN